MDNSSSDSDDYNDTVVVYAAVAAAMSQVVPNPPIPRIRCRDSILGGAEYVTKVLSGHPNRCIENFRMPVDVFIALCNDLSQQYMLVASNGVQIPEMVAMFLFTLGQSASNRSVQERFQKSGETVSRLFHKVLASVYQLAIDVIKPRDNQFLEVPNKVWSKRKFLPFRNAIGAIDGTHIPAVVSQAEQIPYINRKGTTSQNVLAVCDFDMMYLFVAAGFEGSAHDARVLDHVHSMPAYNFPHPPEGKYYLVDAGYANKIGYLVPYRGERYHLPEWMGHQSSSGPRERFNRNHAQLRNVIERTFGVTKRRWKVLRSMGSFKYPTHVNIVIACCGLHNYIRRHSGSIEEFCDVGDDSSSSAGVGFEAAEGVDDEEGGGLADDHTMGAVRDTIATALWRGPA